MGDRGNIAIIQRNNEQVWLYSHWGGYELPERLQQGLRAGVGRYQDDSYLAKIIIGHAVPEDNWKEETGYGISTTIQDNEHEILVVDIPNQRVYLLGEAALKDGKVPAKCKPTNGHAWSFVEYSNLTKLPET